MTTEECDRLMDVARGILAAQRLITNQLVIINDSVTLICKAQDELSRQVDALAGMANKGPGP
jgi:hypothetical protein